MAVGAQALDFVLLGLAEVVLGQCTGCYALSQRDFALSDQFPYQSGSSTEDSLPGVVAVRDLA